MSTTNATPDIPRVTPPAGRSTRGRHRAGRTPESALTAMLRQHPRGVPYSRRRPADTSVGSR